MSGPQRYAAAAAAVTAAAAAQCRDGTENGRVVLSPVTREHQTRADGRRRTDAGAFKRKGAGAKSAKAASSDDGVEDGERGAQEGGRETVTRRMGEKDEGKTTRKEKEGRGEGGEEEKRDSR